MQHGFTRWPTLLSVLFGEAELEKMPAKALSFGLLLFALVCAWLPHPEHHWFYGDTWESFTPDFISGSLALAIIVPLYTRRIVVYPHHSVNSVLFLIVNLALTATFIQILLGKGTGAGSLTAVVVISCAIALSWLGMRAAASLAWIGLLGFCVLSAIVSNQAWGLAGFGFVASGFCGILLQTRASPNRLILEIFHEYSARNIQ